MVVCMMNIWVVVLSGQGSCIGLSCKVPSLGGFLGNCLMVFGEVK